MASSESIAAAQSCMEDAVLELRLLVEALESFAGESRAGPHPWVYPLARRMDAAHEAIEAFLLEVAR